MQKAFLHMLEIQKCIYLDQDKIVIYMLSVWNYAELQAHVLLKYGWSKAVYSQQDRHVYS